MRPARGLASADRSVLFKEVVREIARRQGLAASFTPLLDPTEAGNGVHVHISLLDGAEESLLYDASRPACLSELGERFAAGILLHAPALSALTAPSPISAARLQPHRWSVGALALAQQNREALLRIPPVLTLAHEDAAPQLHLEYRGADAAANPYLALGASCGQDSTECAGSCRRRRCSSATPPAWTMRTRARYGVGQWPASLEDSLQALADDETARGWLGELLYEAYVGVKRTELQAVAGLDLSEVCRRYAAIY